MFIRLIITKIITRIIQKIRKEEHEKAKEEIKKEYSSLNEEYLNAQRDEKIKYEKQKKNMKK